MLYNLLITALANNFILIIKRTGIIILIRINKHTYSNIKDLYLIKDRKIGNKT